MVDSYIFVLSFTLLFAPVTILLTSLNQPRLIGTISRLLLNLGWWWRWAVSGRIAVLRIKLK